MDFVYYHVSGIVGTLFYIYVKLQVGTRFLKNRLVYAPKLEMSQYMVQDRDIVDCTMGKPISECKAVRIIFQYQLNFPTYRNTQVSYFPLWGRKISVACLRRLKKARKFIFMEYFIVEEGYMWDQILEILDPESTRGRGSSFYV